MLQAGLSQDIIDTIRQRRKAKRLKSKYAEFRPLYNKLTSELRYKLREFRNKNWSNFINKIGKNPKSSNCFGEIPKDTFSLNNDFINVSSDREKQSIKFVEITLSEQNEAINKAKDQSAMDFSYLTKQFPILKLINFLVCTLMKTKCMNRLNIIKILSSKNWKLNHNTLASLYKALIGSILDCLNSFSELGLQKLQVIQNSAVRCILKLPLRTFSESSFYEAEIKLNISKINHSLSNLLENYLRNALDYSVPLTKRLVSEYQRGFDSRFIRNPTPLFFKLSVCSNRKTNK
ncbi:hypothetical protein BpHYR1_020922 [Brachionus plicatilis]|uniref:RNA-directed DNA polymerase from mobile element jockey-like n=1 Tax=Brachionus plicatilis TaxID=10195 RepID=A0A3M7RQS5_BRAPC|nr:hypothetical protein BpHYR1_020922 [Brachionus plicatilis]